MSRTSQAASRSRSRHSRSPSRRIKKRETEFSRKTRWDPETIKTYLPGVPTYLPSSLSVGEIQALLIRIRIEELTYKIMNNQFDLNTNRERSPSPTPQYDTKGKRMNTREQRAKDKLSKERHDLIQKATKIQPGFKPPPDYKPFNNKKTKKIFIPIREFPDYNFIGLIIGPRGLTQKKMERESGAKISIRGKGSVKEGKTRPNQPNDEEEELHVLISADTELQLEHASNMIEKLLVPVEEGKNEHKREQLRLLAEINGTLRENLSLPFSRTWSAPDVYCKHCGEVSHPTSDCPLKEQQVDKKQIDDDYESFMAEIGEKPTDNPDTERSYQEFMAVINSNGKISEGEQKSQGIGNEPWDPNAMNIYGQPSLVYGQGIPPWQPPPLYPAGMGGNMYWNQLEKQNSEW